MALLTAGDLTPAERQLCEHARDGQLFDLRSHRPGEDDPVKGRGWHAERQIRSQVLDQLLTGRGDLDTVFSPALAVRLAGAQVVGLLNLGGLTLRCPLALEGCFLDDDVELAKTKAPDISLQGSFVTGRVSARRLQLDHDLDLGRLRCQGGVTLLGAHLGELSCGGATLRNDTGPALSADRLTVNGSLFLDTATVTGEIRLPGAHLGGQLACVGATLTGRTSDGLALDLVRASVDDDVYMRPAVLRGGIDLTYAQVGGWYDDEGSWPAWLSLEGFTYGGIHAPGVGVRRRLDWLALQQGDYIPQPYEQLAAVYRRAGHESSARTVAIAKQRARRASSRRWWVRWPRQAWSVVLRWTIGYGYRPALALVPLLVLFAAGWVLFDAAYPDHFKPANSSASVDRPDFHSARYTADLLLPVVNFKQRDAFVAHGWAAWASFGFIFAGWLLAAVVVAGLTGVFKRD